jgi:transposase
MLEMTALLERWELDGRQVRERMYRSATPRERERWHAIWLLTRGWTAGQVAEALERDPHPIGEWLADFRRLGPPGLAFAPSGGPPPALDSTQQAALNAAVQDSPHAAGLELANWNWKVVQLFVQLRCGRRLSRSSCLNYLHQLGFVLKRPKKRLLKADADARVAFVEAYLNLITEAGATGAKLFFGDEAHFRADADLRGKWVRKGEPALVDSTSPRWGEKASSSSAVCLETGEVEVMELAGTSTAVTSAAFLQQLRAHHPEPLIVIWDNGPAHRGEAIRDYLATPAVRLRLVNLPASSPDFNPDEAIWKWARAEVTANSCLGTKAKVQAEMARFFQGLADRVDEVKRRCRSALHERAEALGASSAPLVPPLAHADLTLALV